MVIQSNPHGLPTPPEATRLLVVSAVAGIWAVGLAISGFLIAAAVIGPLAVLCAVLGISKRR